MLGARALSACAIVSNIIVRRITMADLKPYYDNVLKTQADLQSIINNMDAAMLLGTPKGEEQALALEPTLDEAIAKAERAQAFYDKLVAASKTANVAKNFVPVSETPPTPDEQSKGIMNRAEFEQLDQSARAEFIKNGGKIQD